MSMSPGAPAGTGGWTGAEAGDGTGGGTGAGAGDGTGGGTGAGACDGTGGGTGAGADGAEGTSGRRSSRASAKTSSIDLPLCVLWLPLLGVTVAVDADPDPLAENFYDSQHKLRPKKWAGNDRHATHDPLGFERRVLGDRRERCR